jgi:lipopolysaccharide transport system ATP-binding protein
LPTSSDLAIRVFGLGKQYRIGASRARYQTFRETATEALAAPFRKAGRLLRGRTDAAAGSAELIWALKDVSFEIRRGEIVGVIGHNGAGKSTLLRVLSRITEPTAGRAEVFGRVGSLLEVGTGFHPELTGRENVYLNGAILGMKRAEIEHKLDEIVSFAEIDKFLDTPVKHYSSGMYLRLAFAVAAHLEPEILLVDEVLAVGDAAFQRKCLGRIGTVADQGRTVLFVSHNMTALQTLCRRALWLADGALREDGEAKTVVANYLRTAMSPVVDRIWTDPATAPGNSQVRLARARVRSAAETPADVLTVDTPLVMEFEYWPLVPDLALNLSLVLYNQEGLCILNSTSESEPVRPGLVRGVCHVPGGFLNDGVYRVRLLIVKDASVAIFDFDELIVFEIFDLERRGNWFGKWVGVVRPSFQWTTRQVASS